jgi:2-dehydro-3-deoxyphosphogluconate aldolase/(4S)-4-hydroxy-2-oxoglutarate aldolase
MSRLALPTQVVDGRIIAIARKVPLDRLMDVAAVLADHAIRIIEVTLDGDDALPAMERLAGDGALVVGAGTVRTVVDVDRAVAAGATFIVSPHTDARIVERAVSESIPVVPGALTPSEVVAAWDLGVSAVKLFPASTGGPDHVRAIGGPLGDIPLVATGGVDASNAAAFLDAGAMAVGVGGWLTGSSDLEVVAERARLLVEVTRRS